eukprot:365891-Chlamydomonas_euryale.AAC.5
MDGSTCVGRGSRGGRPGGKVLALAAMEVEVIERGRGVLLQLPTQLGLPRLSPSHPPPTATSPHTNMRIHIAGVQLLHGRPDKRHPPPRRRHCARAGGHAGKGRRRQRALHRWRAFLIEHQRMDTLGNVSASSVRCTVGQLVRLHTH